MTSPLHQLAEHGQSPWLDLLARGLIQEGELERLVREEGVRGVTSNPTIFQKAIASGEAGYDEQLREVSAREDDPKLVFQALAVRDIQDACDVLRAVWDGGRGLDGWVSLEVDPTLAHDTDATLEEARRLSALVDRPNLYVKVPATQAGVVAIEQLISEGIAINVTLVFSLERHAAVMDAYLRGVQRLVDEGGDPGSVCSVASFFISRVDTEIDRRLDAAGGRDDLKSRAAIANAKLAYAQWQQHFASDRWETLAARGASPQWCLWASTSTKDPALRDTLYVEALVGPDTVNTMPIETLEAMQDDGTVEATLETGVEQARALFEELREAGVDLDDAFATLEREGVEKFAASFRDLIDEISSKREQLARA
ncbi:MAG: transaldolase [Solirubrobacteraceae bacterium MAG38_C4-C5]|nr:transaldolase [Candidatus Siliceabacter maunaloa]